MRAGSGPVEDAGGRKEVRDGGFEEGAHFGHGVFGVDVLEAAELGAFFGAVGLVEVERGGGVPAEEDVAGGLGEAVGDELGGEVEVQGCRLVR